MEKSRNRFTTKEFSTIFTIVVGAVISIGGSFNLITEKYISIAILLVLTALIIFLIDYKNTSSKLEAKIDKVNLNQDLLIAGVTGVHKKFPEDLYHTLIDSANEKVVYFHTFGHAYDAVSKSMINAAERGVKVQLLVLDPESKIAEQRSIEMGSKKGRAQTLFGEIESSFGDIIKCKGKENIEIKIHSSIPPFSLFMVDQWVTVGFYWYGKKCISHPMIEFRKGVTEDELGFHFFETFNKIWGKAIPIKTFS